MEPSKPDFEKYLFVCVNERREGERVSCGATRCGKELAEQLKDEVKKAGLTRKVRVTKTYCLDVCEEGPNVILYPDGVWYKRTKLSDIPTILAKLEIQP